MKTLGKVIYTAVAMLAPICGMAQTTGEGKYSVKAYANIGMGDAMSVESALSALDASSSTSDFGIDFGWRFWQAGRHSLSANIGLGLNSVSAKFSLPQLNYSYAASSTADMDGESYLRHTELSNVRQKATVSRFILPVYASYNYKCVSWLSIHADLGLKLGFKTSSKLSDVSGNAYCYGVYPQYDNLMIDADYMNDFGTRELNGDNIAEPEVSAMTASLLVGAGVKFNIYGPLSADVSLLYDAGLSNLYKEQTEVGKTFTAETAPLTYTVKDGSQLKSLTDYLSSSKLSNVSLKLSLIYSF